MLKKTADAKKITRLGSKIMNILKYLINILKNNIENKNKRQKYYKIKIKI